MCEIIQLSGSVSKKTVKYYNWGNHIRIEKENNNKKYMNFPSSSSADESIEHKRCDVNT